MDTPLRQDPETPLKGVRTNIVHPFAGAGAGAGAGSGAARTVNAVFAGVCQGLGQGSSGADVSGAGTLVKQTEEVNDMAEKGPSEEILHRKAHLEHDGVF